MWGTTIYKKRPRLLRMTRHAADRILQRFKRSSTYITGSKVRVHKLFHTDTEESESRRTYRRS